MFANRIFILLSFLIVLSTTSFAQQAEFVQGELLIQVSPTTDLNQLESAIELQTGQAVLQVSCVSDMMHIYLLRFENTSIDLNVLINSLKDIREIITSQKNHVVFARETIPTDTLFGNQWHHKNIGQTGGIVDADMDTPEAWDITTGGLTTHGDTIVVCIIEGSGVDINHIDLQENIWKNYAEIPGDLIDNDNNGYIDDYSGWHVINQNDVIGPGSHGTRVAGMIGAKGNNITGISGVNWDVKMMIVQGQNVNNEASVIAAYTYPMKMRKLYNESLGQEGAFVVATNSSWGINNGDPADSPLWCAMYDSLGSYGILNIAATTNSNANVDLVGDMPTTCASEFLVAVTMTNSQDLRASSGYGTTHVDVGAPGQSVYTTLPSGFYSVASGTSFATPATAGCVALAYSTPCNEFMNFVKFDPEAAALAMRNYLLSSVDQNAGLLSEVASGGRVNVKNCIDSILANCDPNPCNAPFNLTTTILSDTVADMSWEGFSPESIFWFGEYGSALTPTDYSAVTIAQEDSLIACSYYTFSVQSICGSDTSAMSYPFTFQTDGCCDNPPLSVAVNSNNSLSIAWDNVLAATSYDIRYKLSSDATWIEFTNVTSPYLFSGLIQCTDYDFQIHTQCADSTQGYGATQTFSTIGCGACTEKDYCDVFGASFATEWIQSISVNGYSNNTGNNSGWLQSNGIITALTPGQSYMMSFTPGYSGFQFDEGFSVWIDFNQDGIWDASENLISNLITNSSISGILAIPLTAPIGITRIRIGMNSTDTPEICPTVPFYGEYEDYCVYIGPQAGLTDFENNSLLVYPNPVSRILYLNSEDQIVSVSISDYSGKIIYKTDQYSESGIDVSAFASGIYFVKAETPAGTSVVKFIRTNE